MLDRSKAVDSNSVILGVGYEDHSRVIGAWEAWQTGPDGLPIRAMQERDGSMHYRIRGHNALSDEMKNLLRNVVSRLGTNASGPAGGLWTAGPYIALCTTTPNAASTLAALSPGVEVSGGGYVRKAPTFVSGATGSFNNTGANVVTWTAGTDITAATTVTGCFLTPANSGAGVAPNVILISFWALNGGNQTVATGNSLSIGYTWTVS